VPITVLPPVDFHEELEAAFTQLRQAGDDGRAAHGAGLRAIPLSLDSERQ
jgi:hypothetical protein